MKFEIKEHDNVVKCEMTNQKIETSKTTSRSLPKTGDAMHLAFVAFTRYLLK